MTLKKMLMSAATLLLFVSVSQAQFDIPARQGLVNDFDAKLTSEEKKSFDLRLRDFAVRHQVELAVVTISVDRLKGRPIEQYSRQMASEWGIGAGVGKFGLLLLVAIGKPDAQGVYSGSTRLEVSRRLEADITNEAAVEIIRQMRTDLRAGRFADAIQRGIDGTDRALAKKLDQPTPAQSSEESSGWFSKGALFLLVVSLVFVAPVALIISLFVKRRRKAQQNVSASSRVSKQKSYSKPKTNKQKRRGKSQSIAPIHSSYHSDSTTSDWSSSSSDSSSSSSDSSSGGDFGGGGASDSW